MNNIEDTIKDILITDLFVETDRNEILSTHSLRNDLGVDSVGFVELKVQSEKKFGITIDDDDFTPENFATIRSIASLIEGYKTSSRAQA